MGKETTPSAAETPAAAVAAPAAFPTWRIVLWSIGGIGTTIIGSLTGLMTYFFVPPETSQSAFPQFLSTQTILGLTIVGIVGYIGGLVGIVFNPFVATWSDRSRSRVGRRKIFMIVSILPISVLSYLLFSPPIDHVSSLNAVWLFAVVVLLNLFRSLYGVSGALVPEFGSSSRIIMLFSTFSAIGWVIGYIIGSQLVFMIKDALMAAGMSAVDAFRLTVGGMIAVSTVLALTQILVVDEKRYGTGRSSTVPLLPALTMAFKNRTFVLYTLTLQVYYWSDGLFQAGLVYFVTIIFGLSDSMMVLFGGAIAALSFLVYPLVNVTAARTGKKFLFSLALVVMTCIMMIFAWGDRVPIPPGTLAWIVVGLLSIPGAITGIIPGAINNEIIREDCLRTGMAKEASFGAASGLITAIPSGFVGLIMPSLLLLGKSQANPTGVRAVAIASAVCTVAAFVMLRLLYNEKRVQESLKKHGYT
jgi:glycoside/pentoside/hexuronide:cation symporter, GPH family